MRMEHKKVQNIRSINLRGNKVNRITLSKMSNNRRNNQSRKKYTGLRLLMKKKNKNNLI